MVEIAKRKISSKNVKKNVFILCMLAYPLLQFGVFWIGTNIGAVSLTFQSFSFTAQGMKFVGLDNFTRVFREIATMPDVRRMITNSLWYMPVTCFISLPLAVLFSYLLFKKMPLAGAYRVIFFLPSIVPVVVLTMAFAFVFDPSFGPIDYFLRYILKLDNIPVWFADYPINQIMIFVYCIWAGLGYNIILLSGAISRLPQDVMEYNKLEGVGMVRELFTIIIPLIWPTITTTFLLGCTSVFTVMLQPLMLTPGNEYTQTISLFIYGAVNGTNPGYPTAFGLTMSLFGVPIIMFIRWVLGKIYADVEF